MTGEALGLSDNPNELASEMQDMSKFLVDNLAQVALDMKQFADRNRQSALRYSEGDKVLVSTKNIKSNRPKGKWTDKWIGPFPVVKEAHPDSDAYVLELPTSYKIHNVFHTSLLLPYKDSTIKGKKLPPPPPEEED